MPGGRERLNYIETKKLRLAPLGSYCIHYGPAGQRVHVGHKTPDQENIPGGVCMKMTPTKNNPRYANGNLRRKHRARLRAMGCECGICHGRFGPIHYDEPSDVAHPLSFVVDEIKPVAKWKQFGYPSARAAAEDWDNLQAAHYFCNAQKRDKTASFSLDFGAKMTKIPKITDGSW